MNVILPNLSKIGCHGNVPSGIGKTASDQESTNKYLPFGEKIVKIGPVDHEIICLNGSLKVEINASKIYSPVGKFAERAKLLGQTGGAIHVGET